MNKENELNEQFKQIRENLHFILVEPESPGNIGSAARALKTCGFKNLILVNPCDQTDVEARKMAHRSIDIIENAPIYSSFKDAVSSMTIAAGTTMRKRDFKFPFYRPEELADKLLPAALENPTAIVFGRERTGLTNEELLQCHVHSTIPTAVQNPALNLAQAVMIYAHTFFLKLHKEQFQYTYEPASQNELEIFYDHLIKSLQQVNFKPRDGMPEFITRFRRIISRTTPESRDIRLLHKLLQIFETRISDLEKLSKGDEKRNIF